MEENIIKEIKEKIKTNPKYIHPCNKEFQEDIKKLGLTGNQFLWYRKLDKLYGKEFADFAIKNENKISKRYLNAGCQNSSEYVNYLSENKGFKNRHDYLRHLSENKGFKNYTEYLNHLAIDRGFKDRKEYVREYYYNKGEHLPISENDNCPLHQGIYNCQKKVAAPILLIIFEYVEEMSPNNPGFDFICKNPRKEFVDKYPQFRLERNKEYKIDSKGPKLISDGWPFGIKNNNTADYFLLIGFIEYDKGSEPIGIWLIKKDEMIRKGRKGKDGVNKKRFFERETFKMLNNQEYMSEFQKYELKDELENLKRSWQ